MTPRFPPPPRTPQKSSLFPSSLAETVLAAKPAEAAGKGQAADAGRRNHAAGRCQSMDLGLAVKVAPRGATLDPGAPRLGIDVDRVHGRQIDKNAAVARSAARGVVAAAAHCRQQSVLAGEIDCVDDVGGAAASRDERRFLVEHAVPDLPRTVVIRVARLQKFTTQT